jgi:glycosyltransferase involved in cell wall biosynthesis
VHVLLDAAIQAGERLDHPLEVLVFGTRPDPVYWGEEIEPRLALLREGPVRASYEGEFRNEDVAEVMALVDWVAVPSLWWENAPTVMFEAMATGRPILAGDIGGMREALEISSAGRSVSVGSVPSWAAALSEVSHPLAADAWGEVQARARLPWTAQEIVDRHLEVYER